MKKENALVVTQNYRNGISFFLFLFFFSNFLIGGLVDLVSAIAVKLHWWLSFHAVQSYFLRILLLLLLLLLILNKLYYKILNFNSLIF